MVCCSRVSRSWLGSTRGSFLLISSLSGKRAHTQARLFVSTHQCIPLIPLPQPGWKSAGCLREVNELSPSVPVLRGKRVEFFLSLIVFRADAQTWYGLCSQIVWVEVKLHKNNHCFPFTPPPLNKMTSSSMFREVVMHLWALTLSLWEICFPSLIGFCFVSPHDFSSFFLLIPSSWSNTVKWTSCF